MPIRLKLIERILFTSASRSSVCQNCRDKLLSGARNGSNRFQQRQILRRAASTTPSVTAINVKHEIPPAFQKLHASLKTLERDAGIYINISQLQLALKGVESEDAVTRVAVLGINGQAGVRRLVRTLLADPLASDQPWEKELLGRDEEDGRAVLLRSSEAFTVDERHPLIRTFSIPSSTLSKHKLEILVHTINAPTTEPSQEKAPNLLVPGLEIATSITGRSTVTYPVHKALVYEEGLNSLGIFTTFDERTAHPRRRRTLKGVIDWSWTTQQRDDTDSAVSPINLALAERAIDTFRNSVEKSLDYEHLWFDAGMPALSTWLLEGTETTPGSVKPAAESLIDIICGSAHQRIREEAVRQAQRDQEATVSASTRNVINQGISIWSENAHAELRDRLYSAFVSRSWKKTKWWKLFWRVDDISYIATDILQRAWLVEAEKEMIWIVGRIHQSGLLGPPKLRPTPVTDPEDTEQKLGGKPPAPSAADLAPQASNFDEPRAVQHPWPQHMAHARSTLISLTVPPLQALSQALLLQTLSTNILTSALSVLLYVSVSTTSIYESGAVAATGLVYSLRRLQKRWETARKEWEIEVREEGRRVLRISEDIARESVDEYKPEVDETAARERAVAAEAVENVEQALMALKQ